MKDDIKGYLYKRKAVGEPGRKTQVRLNPKDPIDGKFYIQWDIGGHRYVKCLYTSDLDTARQRWADMKANMMFVSDEEKYLQRLIESKENDIRKLQKLQSGAGLILIAVAFDKFLASKYRKKATSEKTIRGYRHQFDRFRKWAEGQAASMRDVTPRLCELYIDDLERQADPVLNAETIDKHVGLLEMVWKVLLPEDKNPWRGLHSTKEHKQTGYRRLSLPECRSIYEAATGEYKTLILLGFSTGQRLGDCVTLDWSDVNVNDGVIGFIPAKTKKRHGKLVLVPMARQLAAALNERGSGPVFPSLCAKYKSDNSALTKVLSSHFITCGVKDNESGRASFHSLRHTFASMLDESGCPLQIRAYLTNHSIPGQRELMPGVTAVYSHPDIAPIRKWIVKVIPKL
jgi:integrase